MTVLITNRIAALLLLGGCFLIGSGCSEGQGGTSNPTISLDAGGHIPATGGNNSSTGDTTNPGPNSPDPNTTGTTDNLQDTSIPQVEIPPELDASPAKSCRVIEQSLPRTPAEVLVLLDRSSSLGEQEFKSGESWWTLTTLALTQGVKASENMVNWGLMLFPKGKDSKKCCLMPTNDAEPQVEVEIGPKNSGTISDILTNTEPSGEGTPTARALLQGANYLKSRTTSTQKYILLITDGDPTCPIDNVCTNHENKDYTRTKETIAHIKSVMHIPVAVIGIAYPNSSSDLQPNPKQLHLIDLAKLGGMPNKAKGQPAYYVATTQQEVQDSFKSLYSQTVSCTYATGLTAPWAGDVAVDLQGKNVPRDPSHEEGWDYGDGGKSIVFFGRSCNTLLQQAEPIKPHLRLGCPNSLLD